VQALVMQIVLIVVRQKMNLAKQATPARQLIVEMLNVFQNQQDGLKFNKQ
jgi:hypothetical protein